jgi:hypothetical protein
MPAGKCATANCGQKEISVPADGLARNAVSRSAIASEHPARCDTNLLHAVTTVKASSKPLQISEIAR